MSAAIAELTALRAAWFEAMQRYHDANVAYRALWSDPEVVVTPELSRERGIAARRASAWMFSEEDAFTRLREAAHALAEVS